MLNGDTIFAQATAQGKAGVAVIRLSGPKAWKTLQSLSGALPEPRKTALRRLSHPKWGFLDQAMVICFAKDHSFTGEEVSELHLHGSLATVKAVLGVLAQMQGLRLAEPGEFTRRALENGQLDIAQIEGLSDLLEAETEMQRKQALRIFSGALGARVEVWRASLIRAVSLLEATIDFADEDIPVDVTPEVKQLLATVTSDLTQDIVGYEAAERIRDGFEVAIIGPPNSGKSTLLNRLAGRDAAITSDVAGTTRDVIEVKMDLSGLAVTFLDTAGLRETDDKVEGLGVQLAKDRASKADMRVFLLDSADDGKLGVPRHPHDIVVYGKSDLRNEFKELTVSGKTGSGVDDLIGMVISALEFQVAGAATATRLRHKISMENALADLVSVQKILSMSEYLPEIAAENLHTAIRTLDSLIGRVDIEQVLDEIFSRFCLGK